ncbi:MAG TPA: M28 family peptidase [Acidobacteriota bacterium]
MIIPRNAPIRAVAAPFSPSTPPEGIQNNLVDAGHGTREEFAKLGQSARGAIALVQTREMQSLGDLFQEYLRNKSLLAAAKEAGVSGLLLQSTRPRGLLYRHPITFGESYAPVPVALISREQGALMARLMKKGPVQVRMVLQNEVGPAYESRNVIAEIRGKERPDEIVLIGAHLDSWDLGAGAQDNGVNVVTVIDVARAVAQLKLSPGRTIRFALFTGEEQGMWGSAGYVQRHAAELDHHIVAITFDIGSGKTIGFYLNGREELRKPIDEILAKVSNFKVTDHSMEAVDGTDNFDFMLSGVPNLIRFRIRISRITMRNPTSSRP